MQTKQLFLLALALLVSTIAFSQVGIGTVEPHVYSILDVESTTKGFLPPRMTDAQRDAIAGPAAGLTIYNTTEKCLQWYNGIGWYNGCDGSTFVAPVTGIPGNTICAAASISVTPCSAVNGATLNDDNATDDGIEYDWTGATGFIDGGTTRALVEIGGQCWYRRNAVNTPSAYDPVPTWVNNSDEGWSGEYTGGPFSDEGKLYQWSAAMNGSTTERAQGVCPTGWHVPSDCEWMYLENTLGMSTNDQELLNMRNSGSVGTKLKSGGSSGFNGLFAGNRTINGVYANRGSSILFWTSTQDNATDAHRRFLNTTDVGVWRSALGKEDAFSVRCIKN